MKRILRATLSVIFVVGVTIALWPLGQRAYGVWSQRTLESQWLQTKSAKSQTLKQKLVRKIRVTSSAIASHTPAQRELPPTRLIIPDIQLEAVVVSGLDDKALARGPGHDPKSALPGEAGNCVIAAHRNVYGSWFYRLDALWPGSQIRLETPDATYKYQVLSVRTVSESDYSVRQPPADPKTARLTLFTCTLPHTPNRIVLIAERMADDAL